MWLNIQRPGQVLLTTLVATQAVYAIDLDIDDSST